MRVSLSRTPQARWGTRTGYLQTYAELADQDLIVFAPGIGTLCLRFRIAKGDLTEAASAKTEASIDCEAAAGPALCLLDGV